jgi:multiple sugar transport system permease protein
LAALPPRRRRSDLRAAIPFLLPGFLGLATFLILPLFASLLLSFSNWQVIGQTRFVGLANYVNLFTRDPIFWGVFRTTLFYTLDYLVLNIVISLGMAAWIGSLAWGRQLFRLVFFLPTVTPLIGISLVWLLMLTPGGIVDGVFAALGLPIPNLITSPVYALQVVVIVSLWSHFGYNMLLFGAALESIPSAYLDAAAIDGARPWQLFWRIKLPLISPSLFFGTVLTTISGLQVFDQVYAFDARRAGFVHHHPRLCDLQPGLRHLSPRLCVGDRLGAVRRDHSADRVAASAAAKLGAL